jgi:hypothetical protein
MSGKGLFRFVLAVGLSGIASEVLRAAPPWGNLISLHSVDANPDDAYSLTDQNGPWLVMACSFSGEGGEKQAQQLAYELRKRYKLPAYTYKGRFDPGEAQGRGIDEFGKPRKWAYWKYKDQKDKEKARRPELLEVAVLVGNYQSVDDGDAQGTLQKIKFARPECLEVKEGKETHQSLTGWRMIQRQVYEAIGSDKKKLGPMSHAFITPNPLLPADYFAPKAGLDEEIVALNKGVPYSLLDCPGKFTVQVATFKGNVIIKQAEIQAIQNGDEKMESELGKAAEKADKRVHSLRMKGYEAYQFHDRYASIVTVGSFNSVGMPRSDGRTEINPEIHQIMKRFGAETTTLPGQETPVTPLKTLVGIPFDIQPIPVEVPKRSISVALRGDERGERLGIGD